MKTVSLLEALKFDDDSPVADPLHVDKMNRILRFTLQPGQVIAEHNSPMSPVNIVILKGNGMFAGSDGKEQQIGPNELVLFEPGENHNIRALDEDLIFIAFLHGTAN